MKAMQKDPAKRYQSAAEMLRDIDEFKRNPSIAFAYKYLSAEEEEAQLAGKKHNEADAQAEAVKKTRKKQKTAQAEADSDVQVVVKTPYLAMLGGISAVEGGRGSLSGVIVGTIIITMLNSGLQMAGINTIWRLAITGLILIVSIILNDVMNRLVLKQAKA